MKQQDLITYGLIGLALWFVLKPKEVAEKSDNGAGTGAGTGAENATPQPSIFEVARCKSDPFYRRRNPQICK